MKKFLKFVSCMLIMATILGYSTIFAYASNDSDNDEKEKFILYQANLYANEYFYVFDEGEESFAQMYLNGLKEDFWLQAAINIWEIYRIADESDLDSGIISKKDMYTLAIFDMLNISGTDDVGLDSTSIEGITSRFLMLVSEFTSTVLGKKVEVTLDNIEILVNKSTFKNIEFNKSLSNLNTSAKLYLSTESFNSVIEYVGYCEDIYDVIMMYAGYEVISQMDQGIHHLLSAIYEDTENPWDLRLAAYQLISHFDTTYSDVLSNILSGSIAVTGTGVKWIIEKAWDDVWTKWGQASVPGFILVFGIKGIRFLANSVFDLDERNRIYYQLETCVNLEKAINRVLIDYRTIYKRTNSYNDAVAFLNALDIYKRCILLGFDYSIELLKNEAKDSSKEEEALEAAASVRDSKKLKEAIYEQVEDSVVERYRMHCDQELIFRHVNWPSDHVQGASFNMTGVITSTVYKIKSVKCEIINIATGRATISQTDTLGTPAYEYSIKDNINYDVKFNQLSAGTYYMVYTAYDTQGNTQTYTTPTFNVVGAIPSGVVNIPSGVMIKQATNYTCTLASAVMAIRYAAYLLGEDYTKITESAVRKVGWLEDVGLYNNFSYGKYKVTYKKITDYSLEKKRETLIQALKDHPEGVALYNNSHCVWLVDYVDGEFYCVDPAPGVKTGVILLSDAYKVRINNSTKYWYISSPDIPAPGEHIHTFGNWQITYEATCDFDGEKERECSACGEYEVQIIPATGHEFGEWYVVDEPTCEYEGREDRDCVICGEYESRDVPSLGGHDYGEWYVYIEPTCEYEGREDRDCSVCGDYESRDIPAIGHAYGEWYIDTYPSCTESGWEVRDCLNCYDYEERELPALGEHSFGDWELWYEPTCTETGLEYRECNRCDEYEEREIASLGSHEWGDWYEIDAPCAYPGEEERECSVCGELEWREIPSLGEHVYGDWNIWYEPTCTEDGLEVRYCEVCGESEEHEIPSLGTHSFGDWYVIDEPTCEYEGREDRDCSICGDYESRDIPATGHAYGEWYVDTDPTCTESGWEVRDCLNCYHYEERELPALGEHRFGDWEIWYEPTCTEDGLEVRYCEVCGDSEERDIPSLDDHVWGEWYVYYEPTCEEVGREDRDCSICGEYETREIPAIDHKPSDWIIDVEPAPGVEGSKYIECVVCGEYLEWATIDPLPVDPEPPYIPDDGDPVVSVESLTAASGQTVEIQIDLRNNPGIAYLRMTLKYDTSVLTLVNVKNGDIIKDFDQGVNFMWSADMNTYAEGTLITLTFAIAEDAAEGDYMVEILIHESYNDDYEDVTLYTENGVVTVCDTVYGDVNGDGQVNGKDVLLLRKYMANYNDDTQTSTVEISHGADANGDGKVNGKDLLLLRKYMANYNDDLGSSSVVLGPAA